MKSLYCIVINGGDGSYSPSFTFDGEWINRLSEALDNQTLPDYVWEMYMDGDGFSPTTLTVPDECTLESLGISYDCADYDIFSA